jgi:hypothetical protein
MAQYQMTFTPVIQGTDIPNAGAQGASEALDQILNGMHKHLPGGDWEPVSHAFSLINGQLTLSVMWRTTT